MIVKEQLYTIEFNPTTDGYPLHIEPLESRIKKNATQMLNEGKLRNPNWYVVGVEYGFEAAVEYGQEFMKEYHRRHRIDK